MKCYKNYFFYIGREAENAINKRMENSEVFPVYCRYFLNDENIQTVRCKKCNVELNLSSWTYYCSNCNSNFCNYCRNFHKVIFNNNILVFDGFFINNRKNGFGITYKINNGINYSGNWENGIFRLIQNIPHSHQFIRNVFDNDYNRDICLKICDSSDSGLSCRRCDLDICDKCLIKINKKLIQFPYYNINIEKLDYFKNCFICKQRQNNIFFVIKERNGVKRYFCCYYCFLNRFRSNSILDSSLNIFDYILSLFVQCEN